MITGVETAGLVLAVIPLLLAALDQWQRGIGKAKAIAGLREKHRRRLLAKVEGLVKQLDWHDAQLNINLKRLMLATDNELNIEELPRDYKDDLWTGPLRPKVECYLKRLGGHEAARAFRGIMENCELLAVEIAEHFEYVMRDPQLSLPIDLCEEF